MAAIKVQIKEVIDYTLKRKGDRMYYLIDDQGKALPRAGIWKTFKACMAELTRKGFEFGGLVTVHQNYSHWADWTLVK